MNEFDSLRHKLFEAKNKRAYREVINACNLLLSIDYTYLYAQKYLCQTYKIVGDTANYNKYRTIEMGLLTSIVSGGDGKTCETPWEAAQVYEEYFVLNMLGEKMQSQKLTQCTNYICDELAVKEENGNDKKHFFDVTQMLIAKEKMLQD